MRADLHVHSSASDGTDPPAEVMRRAARAGLDVVALTDHDTVAGHAEARAAGHAQARAAGGPVTLLPGMELSCQLAGRSLHMLAYLFDPDQPELAAELARIRDDRVIRARAMVDRLAGLGVGISWDQVAEIAGQAVVGRPHIARAMAASGAIASPSEAFTRRWIADGGRAYVSRYALDPVRAIGLIRVAGGVTVLAHPRAGRDTFTSDEQVAGLAAVGLAGLEVRHPDQSATERAGLLALARDLALVATGGSDDHGSLTGYRLGAETTPAEAYEALVSGARPGRSVSLGVAFPHLAPHDAESLRLRLRGPGPRRGAAHRGRFRGRHLRHLHGHEQSGVRVLQHRRGRDDSPVPAGGPRLRGLGRGSGQPGLVQLRVRGQDEVRDDADDRNPGHHLRPDLQRSGRARRVRLRQHRRYAARARPDHPRGRRGRVGRSPRLPRPAPQGAATGDPGPGARRPRRPGRLDLPGRQEPERPGRRRAGRPGPPGAPAHRRVLAGPVVLTRHGQLPERGLRRRFRRRPGWRHLVLPDGGRRRHPGHEPR